MWFKRKLNRDEIAAQIPINIKPPELTGIERYWLERDRIEAAQLSHQEAERREKLIAEIHALEAKIAPEMQRIAVLRQQFDPYWQYKQMLGSAGMGLAQNAMGASLQGLFGGIFD